MYLLFLIVRKQEKILASFAKHPTAALHFMLFVCIIAIFALAWKAIP